MAGLSPMCSSVSREMTTSNVPAGKSRLAASLTSNDTYAQTMASKKIDYRFAANSKQEVRLKSRSHLVAWD